MEYLKDIAKKEGMILSKREVEHFGLYARLLVEWNEKINLTAITAPEEIAVKHFLDSLLLEKCVSIPKGGRLIDVGTGAGFPSIPCAIIRPDIHLTLLDSLNKRVLFLRELTKQLEITAECIHFRAEEAGQMEEYREKYDLAAARAVARLRELAEYCLPFVKLGGQFAALKGPDAEEELTEAIPAIRRLGGEIAKIDHYELPDGSRRSIVVIRKISQTPTKYPRPAGKIKKQPLK